MVVDRWWTGGGPAAFCPQDTEVQCSHAEQAETNQGGG